MNVLKLIFCESLWYISAWIMCETWQKKLINWKDLRHSEIVQIYWYVKNVLFNKTKYFSFNWLKILIEIGKHKNDIEVPTFLILGVIRIGARNEAHDMWK